MYAMYTQIVGKGTKNERNIINYYRSGRKVTQNIFEMYCNKWFIQKMKKINDLPPKGNYPIAISRWIVDKSRS